MKKAIIVGEVARDPEMRFTPSGAAVCTVSVKVIEQGKGDQTYTDYFTVTPWNQMAEWAAVNLQKGMTVLVEADIRHRKGWCCDKALYVDQYNPTNIKILNQMAAPGDASEGESGDTGRPTDPPADQRSFDYDDDIPF